MKWILLCYLLLLSVALWVSYFLKKKKIFENEKFFFSVFAMLNILFLSGFGICYGIHFKSVSPILRENRSLKELKEERKESINQFYLEGSQLEDSIVFLENRVEELEENKTTLETEIKTLKKEYTTLYTKLQNTPLFEIENFPTYDQKSEYPNGCESISLYLMLRYQGVSVTPEQIVDSLKKGDAVHTENGIKYGGDPEIEFIGDPKSKDGYGVFENPIIDVANSFKSEIIKATGKSLDEVLEIVKQGKPVQVWATSYGRTPTKCNTWTHKDSGKTITWYCNFHSMVLIGATSSKVIVSDPLTGTFVNYDRKKFEYAYDFYGRRAIYYE